MSDQGDDQDVFPPPLPTSQSIVVSASDESSSFSDVTDILNAIGEKSILEAQKYIGRHKYQDFDTKPQASQEKFNSQPKPQNNNQQPSSSNQGNFKNTTKQKTNDSTKSNDGSTSSSYTFYDDLDPENLEIGERTMAEHHKYVGEKYAHLRKEPQFSAKQQKKKSERQTESGSNSSSDDFDELLDDLKNYVPGDKSIFEAMKQRGEKCKDYHQIKPHSSQSHQHPHLIIEQNLPPSQQQEEENVQVPEEDNEVEINSIVNEQADIFLLPPINNYNRNEDNVEALAESKRNTVNISISSINESDASTHQHESSVSSHENNNNNGNITRPFNSTPMRPGTKLSKSLLYTPIVKQRISRRNLSTEIESQSHITETLLSSSKSTLSSQILPSVQEQNEEDKSEIDNEVMQEEEEEQDDNENSKSKTNSSVTSQVVDESTTVQTIQPIDPASIQIPIEASIATSVKDKSNTLKHQSIYNALTTEEEGTTEGEMEQENIQNIASSSISTSKKHSNLQVKENVSTSSSYTPPFSNATPSEKATESNSASNNESNNTSSSKSKNTSNNKNNNTSNNKSNTNVTKTKSMSIHNESSKFPIMVEEEDEQQQNTSQISKSNINNNSNNNQTYQVSTNQQQIPEEDIQQQQQEQHESAKLTHTLLQNQTETPSLELNKELNEIEQTSNKTFNIDSTGKSSSPCHTLPSSALDSNQNKTSNNIDSTGKSSFTIDHNNISSHKETTNKVIHSPHENEFVNEISSTPLTAEQEESQKQVSHTSQEEEEEEEEEDETNKKNSPYVNNDDDNEDDYYDAHDDDYYDAHDDVANNIEKENTQFEVASSISMNTKTKSIVDLKSTSLNLSSSSIVPPPPTAEHQTTKSSENCEDDEYQRRNEELVQGENGKSDDTPVSLEKDDGLTGRIILISTSSSSTNHRTDDSTTNIIPGIESSAEVGDQKDVQSKNSTVPSSSSSASSASSLENPKEIIENVSKSNEMRNEEHCELNLPKETSSTAPSFVNHPATTFTNSIKNSKVLEAEDGGDIGLEIELEASSSSRRVQQKSALEIQSPPYTTPISSPPSTEDNQELTTDADADDEGDHEEISKSTSGKSVNRSHSRRTNKSSRTRTIDYDETSMSDANTNTNRMLPRTSKRKSQYKSLNIEDQENPSYTRNNNVVIPSPSASSSLSTTETETVSAEKSTRDKSSVHTKSILNSQQKQQQQQQQSRTVLNSYNASELDTYIDSDLEQEEENDIILLPINENEPENHSHHQQVAVNGSPSNIENRDPTNKESLETERINNTTRTSSSSSLVSKKEVSKRIFGESTKNLEKSSTNMSKLRTSTPYAPDLTRKSYRARYSRKLSSDGRNRLASTINTTAANETERIMTTQENDKDKSIREILEILENNDVEMTEDEDFQAEEENENNDVEMTEDEDFQAEEENEYNNVSKSYTNNNNNTHVINEDENENDQDPMDEDENEFIISDVKSLSRSVVLPTSSSSQLQNSSSRSTIFSNTDDNGAENNNNNNSGSSSHHVSSFLPPTTTTTTGDGPRTWTHEERKKLLQNAIQQSKYTDPSLLMKIKDEDVLLNANCKLVPSRNLVGRSLQPFVVLERMTLPEKTPALQPLPSSSASVSSSQSSAISHASTVDLGRNSYWKNQHDVSRRSLSQTSFKSQRPSFRRKPTPQKGVSVATPSEIYAPIQKLFQSQSSSQSMSSSQQSRIIDSKIPEYDDDDNVSNDERMEIEFRRRLQQTEEAEIEEPERIMLTRSQKKNYKSSDLTQSQSRQKSSRSVFSINSSSNIMGNKSKNQQIKPHSRKTDITRVISDTLIQGENIEVEIKREVIDIPSIEMDIDEIDEEDDKKELEDEYESEKELLQEHVISSTSAAAANSQSLHKTILVKSKTSELHLDQDEEISKSKRSESHLDQDEQISKSNQSHSSISKSIQDEVTDFEQEKEDEILGSAHSPRINNDNDEEIEQEQQTLSSPDNFFSPRSRESSSTPKSQPEQQSTTVTTPQTSVSKGKYRKSSIKIKTVRELNQEISESEHEQQIKSPPRKTPQSKTSEPRSRNEVAGSSKSSSKRTAKPSSSATAAKKAKKTTTRKKRDPGGKYLNNDNLISKELLKQMIPVHNLKVTPSQFKSLLATMNSELEEMCDALMKHAARPNGMFTFRQLESALQSKKLLDESLGKHSLIIELANLLPASTYKAAKGLLIPKDGYRDTTDF